MTAVERLLAGLGRLGWLGGPILTKELRVASRQRRQYLLRFGYLGVLTVFVVLAWLSVVRFDQAGDAAYRISRMSEVGKWVVALIVWFQFVAAQVLAIMLTGTAISEEIDRGTLAVLVTTPLTSFQIVAGKLLSRLLQLLVLLGVSFPLLAIVRVFGGVRWQFVVAGLCVSVTAAIFAAAVTMLFSMKFRRAYATMAASLVAVVGVHVVLSLALALTCFGAVFVPFVSPVGMLLMLTIELMRPAASGGFSLVIWPAHCIFVLAGSVGILIGCAKALRKVALKRALGEAPDPAGPVWPVTAVPLPPALPVPAPPGARPDPAWPAARHLPPPIPAPPAAPPPAEPPARPPPVPAAGRIRRIEGSAICWREFARPILGGPTTQAVVLSVGGVQIVLMYLLMLTLGGARAPLAQGSFVSLYLVAGMAWTALLACTTIAAEKESRCWPLLMTTPLSAGHILGAKVLGVLRRSWPVWVLLAGHVGVFSAVGCLHPIVLVHVLMLAGGVLAFLLGTCIYFSARLRRTTSAVVAGVGVPLLLWLVGPVAFGMALKAAGLEGREALRAHLALNPVVGAMTVTAGATSESLWGASRAAPTYIWPFGRAGAGATTLIVLTSAGAYAILGGLFAWRAGRRFRKDVF